MIRAAIDTSVLAQTRAGTARYLKGLLRELERRDDVSVSARHFGGGGRAAAFARDAAWYPLVLGRERKADVLHCPTYRGPLGARVPLVVTVHDLAVLRHPETFNRWTRTYSPRVVPRVLRAARRIIAVSEFTRRELVELLDVPPERISVVPNGVEVGGNGVSWLGEVDDAELARLYRGAVCLAYPSLYEGFGIPVLEAFASGVPVVASNTTSLPEVTRGAALDIDPLDSGAIKAAMLALATDAGLRARCIAAGRARATQLSWRATAAQTAAVYRAVLAR